jgi:small subunit ribosomal protein S3Ae
MKEMRGEESAPIRKIRRKRVEIMTNEGEKVQLRELVKKLIPESLGKEIEKHTQGIFPSEGRDDPQADDP